MRTKKEAKASLNGLKIIPLGGLKQIGMNITAFEYEDSIVVVDCGLSFPEDEMLGIDLVIPDVEYLKQNLSKVKGFVITHGHEDHIGALPYVLRDINVPVYATKLTMAIIENKLKEHNLVKTTKRKIIKYGQSINLGCFRIEFIRINHSWLFILLPEPYSIPEILRWITPRFLATPLICSGLERLGRRASWL